MPAGAAETREFKARVSVAGLAGPPGATVKVDAEGFECGATAAGPVRVDFVDVARLARSDLTVGVSLFDGTEVVLDKAGSPDDLWEMLRANFRARVSDSLRFAPADPRLAFDGEVELTGDGAFAALPARVGVTRLGLTWLCDAGPCAQVPWGLPAQPAWDEGAYVARFALDAGEVRVGKLARRSEEFVAAASQARQASLGDTARCIAQLAPRVALGARAALAAAIGVGRVVSRAKAAQLAPGAFEGIWQGACSPARLPYRDALLAKVADPERLFLGLKPFGGVEPSPDEAEDAAPAGAADPAPPAAADDPAPVDVDSDFPLVWFAAFLEGADAAHDALVMEVLSEKDHATYVFRTPPPGAGEDRAAAGRRMAELVGRALLAIDFKKEPLYLPEDQLITVQGGRYRAAWHRLPGLKAMRAALLGRAIHASPGAWMGQMEKLRGA